MKGRKNPIAKALRSTETNLRPKVIKNKKAYSRKDKYSSKPKLEYFSFVRLAENESTRS